MGTGQPATQVLYADAPFGVTYLVAHFEAVSNGSRLLVPYVIPQDASG